MSKRHKRRVRLLKDRENSRQPHIILVIGRGEAVRNFLYSDTLPILAQRARITILAAMVDDSFVKRFGPYAERILPLNEYVERRPAITLRTLLHYAHFRWVWSEAVKYHWGLHSARAKSFREKLRWNILTAGARLLSYRPLLEGLTRIDEALSWHLRPSTNFEGLFRELQPDLVFNGSHIHGPRADLPVRVAHRLGIPAAGFIFSWDNLTSRSRIFVPYDYYLMWNEEMPQQLLGQYPFLDSDRVIITGTPQFDFHFKPGYIMSREELCAEMGLDSERPFILYTTGLDSDFLDEHRIVEAVIDCLNRGELSPRPQLVVRTYIKGTSPEMLALARRGLPDVVFPPILWNKEWIMPLAEDQTVYNSLLKHCALGINAASTVSLELMMYDKPVINLGMEPPNSNLPHYARFARHVGYDHYKPVVDSGAVMVAHSVNDLQQMIQLGLSEPERDKAARHEFLRTMFGNTLDGLSGERVAETLLNIAQNSQR